MGRRWGVSSLANWVTSDVGPGSAQDSFGMPKQDLRKPQPLLESISPHQPPTTNPPAPATTLEAYANTEPSDSGVQRTADSLGF